MPGVVSCLERGVMNAGDKDKCRGQLTVGGAMSRDDNGGRIARRN